MKNKIATLFDCIKTLCESDIERIISFVLGIVSANQQPDRPACPHCGHAHVIKYGHTKEKQRFFCHGCRQTFLYSTGTLAYHSHFSRSIWADFIRDTLDGKTLDDYLFSTTIKGVADRMSVGNAQRIIKKYAAQVRAEGVVLPESVHCHMFRRTRATNLYQDGVAIELVSTVLGHARTDTTKNYYAKASVEQLRDVLESVPIPTEKEEPLWVGNEDEIARRCGLR